MYEIKIEDEELMRALENLNANARELTSDAIMETMMHIEADAKQNAPVLTGRLRASITSKLKSWNEGVVGTNVKYAPYQEYGTRAHVIYPKHARALRWVSGGRVHYAKHVFIPAMRGKYYMRAAFERNREALKEALLKRIREYI